MQKEYKGINGVLIVTDTGITIHRGKRGAFLGTASQRGDKTISYGVLSAVQLQNGGLIQRQGYIRFSFIGGTESKPNTRIGINKDENTIIFATKRNKEFAEAKQLIEQYMRQASIQPLQQTSSDADELAKLASLKEQGVITQEELEAKKKQILGL